MSEKHPESTFTIPRERVLEMREAMANLRAAKAEFALAQTNLALAEKTAQEVGNAVGAMVVEGGAYEIVGADKDGIAPLNLDTGIVPRRLTDLGKAREAAQLGAKLSEAEQKASAAKAEVARLKAESNGMTTIEASAEPAVETPGQPS